jgi:hypothetical protein
MLVITATAHGDDAPSTTAPTTRTIQGGGHVREGENVLYGEGHVEFEKNPFVEGAGDAIYTRQFFVLNDAQTTAGAHHTRHADLFANGVPRNNIAVLQAIDKVQATAMDGGGYFIGVKAQPPESPIGYELKLFGKSLLNPPRKTSYCSGSSYSAFIEALNILLPDGEKRISADRLESLRMQEPDGGRREDGVKFWGHWNDDGFGSQFALVQYSGAGIEVKPRDARPGDFMNISWKSGLGHSVVFLGFFKDKDGTKKLLYWASQKGTNGLGDQASAIDKIKEVKIVRLVDPEKLFSFDPTTNVNRNVPGDKIDW